MKDFMRNIIWKHYRYKVVIVYPWKREKIKEEELPAIADRILVCNPTVEELFGLQGLGSNTIIWIYNVKTKEFKCMTP